MNELLIATHNPAKKQELGEGFLSAFIKMEHVYPSKLQRSRAPSLLTLDDLHITADPEETGKTFLENARLKAHYFAKQSGLPTVSDDGGIEIDCLNGEPGVHSKRWLGREATDREMVAFTLEKLKNIPYEKRSAHFTVCLYYMNPISGFETYKSESVDGYIALSPSKMARKGFPYRALFVVGQFNTFYDELTEEQHRICNHRLRAVQKLSPFIKEDLLQ